MTTPFLSLGDYSLVISLLFLCLPLSAQNHLYTTEQYGINGAMLGGAVTAGTDDVSMTFYNPAAIHQVSPQLNISLIQPALTRFGFSEFWRSGEESQLNTNFRLKPTLISFKLKVKNFDIAFLKLNKSEIEDTFSAQQEQLTGNLRTTQFFDYAYRGQDDWFGLGTNLKLNPNLYIGISQFLSIARFSYTNSALFQEIDLSQNDQLLRYIDSDVEGSYRNIGQITKLGILLNTEKHDLGFTLTTPTYARLNKGGDLFNAQLRIIEDETVLNQVIDIDLSPVIRTPWELSLGYSLALNADQTIWLNGSYHSAIAEYTMSNLTSSSGENIAWRNGSQAVFNFSAGYSHQVNQHLLLSGGFRTNHFAYENKVPAQGTIRNIILDGNHLHFVAGAKLQFKRNTILLGLDYGTLRNLPNEGNFQRISTMNVIGARLQDLRKTNVSLLLTYGFIIDEIRKLAD